MSSLVLKMFDGDAELRQNGGLKASLRQVRRVFFNRGEFVERDGELERVAADR